MSLTIFPTFFPDFRCKAGACRHTCCQTWEIDIDEDTKDYYQTLKSRCVRSSVNGWERRRMALPVSG